MTNCDHFATNLQPKTNDRSAICRWSPRSGEHGQILGEWGRWSLNNQRMVLQIIQKWQIEAQFQKSLARVNTSSFYYEVLATNIRAIMKWSQWCYGGWLLSDWSATSNKSWKWSVTSQQCFGCKEVFGAASSKSLQQKWSPRSHWLVANQLGSLVTILWLIYWLHSCCKQLQV